jgi:hypothetical protein
MIAGVEHRDGVPQVLATRFAEGNRGIGPEGGYCKEGK